jgi:hypothetical protein
MGYMLTLSLYPSVPVEQMWRRKPQPGDLYSPPDVGRHGMTKNRFKKLRELHTMMFSKDEEDLDETDPWRYSRAPIIAFNSLRHKQVIPSWLMLLDESMSAWRASPWARGVHLRLNARADNARHTAATQGRRS